MALELVVGKDGNGFVGVSWFDEYSKGGTQELSIWLYSAVDVGW